MQERPATVGVDSGLRSLLLLCGTKAGLQPTNPASPRLLSPPPRSARLTASSAACCWRGPAPSSRRRH